MDPFNASISVEFVEIYSWHNRNRFFADTAEEAIELEKNALWSWITCRYRLTVLVSRFSTKHSYYFLQKCQLPSCGCSEDCSNELRTPIEMKDFAAAKQLMPGVNCITLKNNIVRSGAQKVMIQGAKFEPVIRTGLSLPFPSAEFYFASIMIFCLYLTFGLHSFSHKVLSFCTTFGKYGLVSTKLTHSVEEIDADGDDHRKSNRSDSKCGSGDVTSFGSGSSGGVYVGSGGAGGGSSAGGDDGDDERGNRKKFGGPQSEDHMADEENEENAEAEELEDEEESDPNKKKMVGGCGRFGNFMRRRLEEEQEKEEAERHRQAMISHYEAWERSNAAARAYVRKNIAKVEPEAYSSAVASGSSDVYDANHPAFTMAFATPVPTPGSRFLNHPEPAASSSHDVGDEEQTASNVSPTISKLEEEDPEADRERSVSPDIPTEGAPSRSPSPPREAL